jgi:hypothetical protein
VSDTAVTFLPLFADGAHEARLDFIATRNTSVDRGGGSGEGKGPAQGPGPLLPEADLDADLRGRRRYTFFVGCQAMTPGAAEPGPNGTTFEQRSYSGPFPTGTIAGISIVFDEGNDVGRGYVYLDDVEVTTETASHMWTSASDNGNGETITQDPTGTDFLSALIGDPVSMLFPS